MAGHVQWSRRPGPRGWVLLVGAAVTVALIGLHGLNRLTFDWRFFALDEEQNLPSWVSALTFGITGVAWAVLGALSRGPKRIAALLTACLLALLSLDDVSRGHEKLEDTAGENLMVLILEPLAVLPVIALIAWDRRYLASPEHGLLGGAIWALVLAQAASSAYTAFDLSSPQVLAFLVLEESSELLFGVLLLAAAIDPVLRALGAALGGGPPAAVPDGPRRSRAHDGG